MFSDPNFEYSQEEMDAVLRKHDGAWNADDYMMIFNENLPICKYSESVYFIPFLIDFVRNANSSSSGLPDVIENFLGWVHRNVDNLKRDGFLEDIISDFQNILKRDLSTFVLVGCANGWYLPAYFNRVVEVVSGLNRVIPQRHVADELIEEQLCDLTCFASAAWMLYLSYEYSHDMSLSISFKSDYVGKFCSVRANIDKCASVVKEKGCLSECELRFIMRLVNSVVTNRHQS